MAGPPLQLTPKRMEIADAALRIIGRDGIAALTTTALAAELGVSAGAPFRHFANREEILEGVALRVEELILQTFPDRSGRALERIRLLFRARARTVGRHAGIASLMFSDQFTLALPGAAAKRLRNLVASTPFLPPGSSPRGRRGGRDPAPTSRRKPCCPSPWAPSSTPSSPTPSAWRRMETLDAASATLLELLAPAGRLHSPQK